MYKCFWFSDVYKFGQSSFLERNLLKLRSQLVYNIVDKLELKLKHVLHFQGSFAIMAGTCLILKRSISTSCSLYGKRNFRKFPLYNKRGHRIFKENQAKSPHPQMFYGKNVDFIRNLCPNYGVINSYAKWLQLEA